MLKFKQKKDKRSEIDKEIDAILGLMKDELPGEPEYDKNLEALERLTEIRAKEKPVKEVRRIDPNTILVVLGGIAEIVLIMSYENLHIISKNALGRVLRPKI